MGELFYRIVTSWSVDTLSKTAADILAPIQLGLGVPGGVETALLFIQTLLTEINLGFACIATDLRRRIFSNYMKMYNFPGFFFFFSGSPITHYLVEKMDMSRGSWIECQITTELKTIVTSLVL